MFQWVPGAAYTVTSLSQDDANGIRAALTRKQASLLAYRVLLRCVARADDVAAFEERELFLDHVSRALLDHFRDEEGRDSVGRADALLCACAAADRATALPRSKDVVQCKYAVSELLEAAERFDEAAPIYAECGEELLADAELLEPRAGRASACFSSAGLAWKSTGRFVDAEAAFFRAKRVGLQAGYTAFSDLGRALLENLGLVWGIKHDALLTDAPLASALLRLAGDAASLKWHSPQCWAILSNADDAIFPLSAREAERAITEVWASASPRAASEALKTAVRWRPNVELQVAAYDPSAVDVSTRRLFDAGLASGGSHIKKC